jgi:signal transduction histidine kinase
MSANAYQRVHITTISPKGAATFRRPDRKLIRDRTLRETGVATDATVRDENVRLEERTRIAQELHDTLLQSFASASMQLHVTLNHVPLASPVRLRLDRILEIIEKGMEEGRNAIQGLRSTDSRTLDLFLALPGIQQELPVQSDIDFRVFEVGQQKPLKPTIHYEICRIGREALVNAFRHSGAKRVEFELEYNESDLRMRVRDNGCGIDPHVLLAGREGHFGLAGMRERATRIGGLLEISSSAKAGTEIQLSVPGRIAFPIGPREDCFSTLPCTCLEISKP